MKTDSKTSIIELIMSEIELVPYRHRWVGVTMLILAIPLAFGSLALFKSQGISISSDWFATIFHYPIAIGLLWLNFSKEKIEDEMVQLIRYQSFMRGVRVLAIALLLLPFFSNLSRWLQGKPYGIVDLGGMLAVLNLLLVYIIFIFKLNLYLARKKFSTHEE
jgi:hypothetical protein